MDAETSGIVKVGARRRRIRRGVTAALNVFMYAVGRAHLCGGLAAVFA